MHQHHHLIELVALGEGGIYRLEAGQTQSVLADVFEAFQSVISRLWNWFLESKNVAEEQEKIVLV